MAGKNWLEDLNPRVSLSIGVTLPTGQKYKMIKAEAGLAIDKPPDMTVNETYDLLEARLLERLDLTLRGLEDAIS